MPLCLYVKEHACNDLYCDITPTCIPFCCLPEDGSERAKWCRTFYSTYILLLQSALQPLWVLSCSTIPEYSQQEGFYRVPLPAARQTPNLENQWLERSNSLHQVSPTPETLRANPSSGRWNYGREIAENFAESGDFVTFGFFYVP